MQQVSRPSGVSLTTPDSWIVRDSGEPPRPPTRGLRGRVFGPVALPAASGSVDADDLVAALAAQEMTVVDQIELQAGPVAASGTRSVPAASQPTTAELALDLAVEEDAVVLLEQDGLYSWHFASKVETSPPSRSRGIQAASARKTARFSLEFGSSQPTDIHRRRGFIADFLIGRARVFVLKFAARVVVDQAMKHLERNVRRGLVIMDSFDPMAWKLVEDASHLKLPEDRPARLLLFVHGTFSSTVGSFGGLGATPWGQEFLAAARANYDATIGFDHATLGEDPLVNAGDLLRRLQARSWRHTPCVDAISYSRGGIVLRSLLEHLLPASPWKPQMERVVFVGAVNGGTLLAKPEHWHTLIDLYTNLAAGACRAVALFPQATIAATLLRELVQSLGAFAKHLATHAVTEGGIPGLAAMDPGGDFIRRLNETQPGQPAPDESQYFAVTSVFSPRLIPDSAKDLPRQLVLLLADGLVDQLMGEGNDLVVNTASMTAIDAQAGNFIRDQLGFGTNGVVYHTNYFLQPQTSNALARWLRLEAPASATPARSRAFSVVGGVSPVEMPVRIDTDVLVLRADGSAEEAREQVLQARPSYVVVERLHQGAVLRYAFPAEEALSRIAPRSQATLLQALDLHEFQASPVGTPHALPAADPASPYATARRVVAVDDGRVTGVVPGESPPLSLDELVELARRTSAPATPDDHIVRRRGLPTFALSGDTAAGGMSEPTAMPPAASGSPPKMDAPAPSAITCHFHAGMEEEVELNRTATVEVTLSREEIQRAIHAGTAGGSAEVDLRRQLIVQLVAKVNFQCVGESRAEIAPPDPGQPRNLYFDVKPTSAGEGEIWVVIRQGHVPLVNLILKPRIVVRKTGAARRITAPASTLEAPLLAEPLHQLSIFERRNGDEVFYQFILDSPALGLKSTYDSKPIRGDRATYVKQLYTEIENRWVSSHDDTAAFQEELRAFGAQLWDELIPPGLQGELWQHRDRIRSVLVFSEEPFIPWELLHLKAPNQALGAEPLFLAQKGVVRWLHNLGWPPDQLAFRAGHCRYVIPKYPHPDYQLPEAQQETSFLEQHFQATSVEPQPNPVRRLLSEAAAFDLLHFAGHGVAEQENIANAQLLLEGRLEQGKYLPAYLSATTVEQFANLKGSDGRRPVVVLNACQAGRAGYKLCGIGGFARAFLSRGAGLFVGCLWAAGDRPARSFTEKFYERLLAGEAVAEAAIAARETARATGEATWLAYVVYGHPHAKWDRQT